VQVLEQVNDTIVEREAGTTNEEIAVANRVKEGMRKMDVARIVEMCKTVLDNYSQWDKDIVVGAIDTLADLIDWNELGLFENSFQNITQMLDEKEYQQNALYWFYSFLHKGMDAAKKIQLVRDIDIISKIKSFRIDPEDTELCQSISDIISKLGNMILEIVWESMGEEPHLEDAQNLLFDLLVLNIMFLEWEDIKSSQYIVRFINNMVAYLKKIPELNETLTEILVKIQDVCIQKIEYPEWCTFDDGNLGEDEENFKVLRADLVNLFSNTLLVTNLKSRAVEIIQAKISELKGNVAKFSQNKVELPLFLLTQMHQIISREDKDLTNPIYQKLMSEFIEVEFLSANSKIVSILYYEVWVKFASYFIQHPEAIPQILENFMSDKGVLSGWQKLVSRSSFFLLRFIDRLRPQLEAYAELIFSKSQEVIELAETGQTCLISNDIENFYEIIGSMLEGFKMDPTKVNEILTKYFEVLKGKIGDIVEDNFELVIDYIRRMNMLLKAVKEDTASASKDLLLHMCEWFFELSSKLTYPVQEYTVMLQKSLHLAGIEVLKYIDGYITHLLSHHNWTNLDTAMRVITYVILEVEEGLQLMDKYIVELFGQMERIGFPEGNQSDEDKDKLSVFGKFTKMIQTWVQKNSLALLNENSISMFEKILGLLMFLMKQNVEKQFRKDSLLILRSVLIEFTGWTVSQIKQLHLGDKNKIEERKIINNSDYKQVWQFLASEVTKASFEIFEHLNLSDPIDLNWIYFVSLIHVIMINTDSDFASNYEKNVTKVKPDIDFNELARLIQLFSEGQIKVSGFKQKITKIWRSSN
jgi:hypothetical protein